MHQAPEDEKSEEPQTKNSKAAGKGNLAPRRATLQQAKQGTEVRQGSEQITAAARTGHFPVPPPSSVEARTKWWQRDWDKDKSDKDSKEVQDLKALVKDLSRLVLRQSDAVSYHVGFMLFLKTSMTPCLENEPEAAVDRTIAIAQPLQGGNQMALRRGEGPGHSAWSPL